MRILNYRSASVQAVMNSTDNENRFSRALVALEKLATEQGIPIAIVGGLAAIRYGYPAVTEDIDVAIGQTNLEKLIRVASDYGFVVAWQAESGWHTLEHGDVEINIVPEGGKAKNSAPTTIPGPPELGVNEGLGYASLPSWMELKISAGRRKDQAHVVEVLKVSDAATIATIRSHLLTVQQDYVQIFDTLASEAAAERQQEDERK